MTCDHSKTHAKALYSTCKTRVWYTARWALCYEQDCDGQPCDACVEKAEKVLKEADHWEHYNPWHSLTDVLKRTSEVLDYAKVMKVEVR